VVIELLLLVSVALPIYLLWSGESLAIAMTEEADRCISVLGDTVKLRVDQANIASEENGAPVSSVRPHQGR